VPVSKPRRKSRPLIKISAGFATAIALTIGIYYYQGSRISASERQWVQQVFSAKTLAGDSNYVNPIAIAPDSKTLATGGEDGAIKLWNLQTGTQFIPSRLVQMVKQWRVEVLMKR
jgi:WD40 repeat protein